VRVELKDFQEEYVDQLSAAALDAAARSLKDPRKLQTISFSAPTGAGKTVMIAAVIENILESSEVVDGQEVTFLWLSDQLPINAQSMARLAAVSDVLGELGRLILVDQRFDQETFDAGTVSFLNVQKLRTDAKLTTGSNKRRYTVWETINNTINSRSGPFFMIVDEAHRGVKGFRNGWRPTIVSKFLFGREEIAAIPIVIGMSATPSRFEEAVREGGRGPRVAIDVKADKVRESGLIKDRIVLR